MVRYSELQHPRIKGEKPFQDFCLKLLRHEWDDPYAELHGRSGQAQHGADITGKDNRGKFKHAACQCKGSEKNEPRQLTESELEREVELAKGFTPKLDLLIVAYSGERDAPLQRKALELDKANRAAGLFRVVLWSWDDIVERAESYAEVKRALLVEDEYILSTALDPKRPQGDVAQQIATLQRLTESLQSSLLVEKSATAPVDAIAEAKIDVWRDQILSGNGKAVVEPLRNFIQNLSKDANPHVRFRAHANLGAALEQDRQPERAAVEFEEAAKAEPGTAASHAYKARALIFREHRKEAYDEAEAALAIDNGQVLAGAVLIASAPPAISTSALEKRLEGISTDVNIATSLASRYSENKEHDAALRVARAAEVKDSAIPRDTAIAQAILHRFEDNLMARMGASLSEADLLLIQEAAGLLEKGWAWAKARPDISSWVYIGANLVSAYRLLGDDQKADLIALEAYQLAPEFTPLIERVIIAYMHREDHARALELANRYADESPPRGALIAADVSAWAGDWENLVTRAQIAFDGAENDNDKARAAELIVLATYRLKDENEALAKADELRPAVPATVNFEARAAELARRIGDAAEVEAAQKRLEAFDPSTLNPLERFELASSYADGGDWVHAAELMDGLYALDRPSHPLRQRLFFLYRADQRAAARELFESLKGQALRSAEILSLGAAIYERSGMIPQALSALRAAIAAAPGSLRSRLDWVRLSFRNNDEKSVSKWIRKATVDYNADPEDLLELAQLLDRYHRRQDALALGYRTMRRHWGRSEQLHLMFMSLFLLHSRAERFLRPTTVGVDTVVFLESDHGGKRRSLIEENPEPSPDSLAPYHAFAKLLFGKTVNDVVTLDQGIGQPENWRIVEIKHKYIDLFHQALDAHETAFPGSRALGHFHIDPEKENGFEPIFEQARARARLVDQATKLYQESVIPIDTVAKIIGVDPIDASRGLRFRSNVIFDSCIGTEQERSQAKEQISGVREFMVDPVTLSIWQEIGLLEVVEAIPETKIQVIQATLDELVMRVEQAEQSVKQKGGSLEAHAEGISYTETTSDQRKKLLEGCQHLLKWCRTNAEVVPTEALELLSKDEAARVLSGASTAMLATAVQSGKPCIIEDRRLRLLAYSLGVKRAGWTQTLLMQLVAEDLISRETYVRMIAALHRQRVGFISVGGEDLLSTLSAEGGNSDFNDLVNALSLPTVEPRSLANVISNFITEVWSKTEFLKVRDSLSSALLEILLVRPDGIQIFKAVAVMVNNNLSSQSFAMSIISNYWSEYIEAFVRGHFIRHLLVSD